MIPIIKMTPNKGAWKTKIIFSEGRKKNQYFCFILNSHFIKKNGKLNNRGSVTSDMKKSSSTIH